MKRTDQTLLEQMQISDVEINRRMELFDLSVADMNLLTMYKVHIEENVDIIVDEFYEKQTQIDEIALLIGDADTLQRLRTAQRKYILDLFSGHLDSEYVNNRLRIGMVHKRIGVDPKLYLSAINTLKQIIKTNLSASISDARQLGSTLEALDKLLYFDITLVFDTYIDSLIGEIETAKRRTETYAQGLESKVAERTRQLEELARKDPLTNLFNQRAMLELMRRELAVAKRNHTKLSFVYFDVDHFKAINDNEGHIKGDEVLRKIGQILLNTVREVDVPCRYGGDEFCVILPNCDIAAAETVCKKLIKEFGEKYPDYSLSIGISETGTDAYADSDALIAMADEKMYMAKKESGFQIRF